MIEWMGNDASEDVVDIQRELCRWRLLWPLEPAYSLLAFRVRQMADRLLAESGLAEPLSR
jgi:hypothetical protein